ncbi:MAG: hypothetical protein NZ932_03220 [Candidatus Bathyarchaeota archaeon]|nr:hypothetical protein [Candidatus Bathyarchaeota archaeon]
MTLVEPETGISGNGTLLLISFEVVNGLGSCVGSPLEFKQTLIIDSAVNPIAHDQVGAVVFGNRCGLTLSEAVF